MKSQVTSLEGIPRMSSGNSLTPGARVEYKDISGIDVQLYELRQHTQPPRRTPSCTIIGIKAARWL